MTYPRPKRTLLVGRTVAVEPLSEAHEEALWEVARDAEPGLWDFMPYGPFEGREEFGEWQARCRSSQDPLFFAIVPAGGGPAGMLSLARIKPQNGVIEIGHIWLGPSLQRTTAATEAIFLVAGHVFDELGYRRLEWKCDARNERSRRAAERFGFTYEGTFRQHMLVKGRSRDTAWLAILDHEWPERRARFERWLDPANFDADGRQRTSLN